MSCSSENVSCHMRTTTHPRRLISAFVVCCLNSIISLDSIAEISRLASFCGCTFRFVSGLVGNSRRHVLSWHSSCILIWFIWYFHYIDYWACFRLPVRVSQLGNVWGSLSRHQEYSVRRGSLRVSYIFLWINNWSWWLGWKGFTLQKYDQTLKDVHVVGFSGYTLPWRRFTQFSVYQTHNKMLRNTAKRPL